MKLFSLTLILLGNVAIWADVQPCRIFSDHAVIQRDCEVKVWGRADHEENITVEFNGQKISTTALEGRWEVKLKPMPANSQSQSMTIKGKNTVMIQDLLIGDVWIGSGQSNMEWALGRCDGGEEAVSKSDNNQVRLGTVAHNAQLTPQADAPIEWAVSSAKSSKNFSGLGYWFAHKLQKQLNIPIGIVRVCWGGTTIQSWMSAESLSTGGWPQNVHYNIHEAILLRDKAREKLKPEYDKYLAEEEAAKKSKKSLPNPPAGWPQDHKMPTTLWNGMIHPILNYPVKGVLWYQGENNTYVHLYKYYQELLMQFIQDWRSLSKQQDLPFIIYQISRFKKPESEQTTVKFDYEEDSLQAQIRSAQLKTRNLTDKSALVVTMDLAAMDGDVHYKNKETAAERGVQAALALAYGRSGIYEGPKFVKADFKSAKVKIEFSDVGGGLLLKTDGDSGFMIAGKDKNFLPAHAAVLDNALVVYNDSVTEPVAIRYAWGTFPSISLYNKEGFPASPFRTDDWEIGK